MNPYPDLSCLPVHSYVILPPSKQEARNITLICTSEYSQWLTSQDDATQQALARHGSHPKAGTCLFPPAVNQILLLIEPTLGISSVAKGYLHIPDGVYRLQNAQGDPFSAEEEAVLALGIGLEAYHYTYFIAAPNTAKIILHHQSAYEDVINQLEALYLGRDLINAPASVVDTLALANTAQALAKRFGMQCSIIQGDDLLKGHYPAIHAVGRASTCPPLIIDLRHSAESTPANAPHITLVGKGVIFDTGGLSIKTHKGMELMKKDMGGAACVLSLVTLIMQQDWPIHLRALIPVVDNAIAGNALRPSDVIDTRKGLRVEIGSTDAEGRLILCDAITEADSENPDIIIDFATLTGAARIALGTELPAFFTQNSTLAALLRSNGHDLEDPLWQLPLHTPYSEFLKSAIADIRNDSTTGYGGAITAALYLQHFVENTKDWIHIDLMGWNLRHTPTHPIGGEVMSVRTIFASLRDYFAIKATIQS